MHAEGMRELVGVSSDIRQGDPFGAMRLDFELSFGTAIVRVDEGDFSIAVRVGQVALRLRNCSIRPQSTYEKRLAEGEVAIRRIETIDRSSGRETSVGAHAEGGAGSGTGLTGRLGLTVGFRGRKKVANDAKETLDRRPRLDLVVTAGQDRWQIGHPRFSDARREDGRLQGTYFNEDRDENGDPRPLCTIVGDRPDAPAEVVISALVRSGQIIVSLAGEATGIEQLADVEAALRKRGVRAARTHERKAADLRSRMAGLVLAKEMLNEQKSRLDLSGADILLARQSLIAVMAPLGRDEDR